MKLAFSWLFLGVTVFSTHVLACAKLGQSCTKGAASQCQCNGGNIVSLTPTINLVCIPALCVLCYLIPRGLMMEWVPIHLLTFILQLLYHLSSFCATSLLSSPLYFVVPINLSVVQFQCSPVYGRSGIRKFRKTPPQASYNHTQYARSTHVSRTCVIQISSLRIEQRALSQTRRFKRFEIKTNSID